MNMNANTHDLNITTIPALAQEPNPRCDRILLGIDQHAADLRVVRQLDGAGPQPPQRIFPGAALERFINKQFTLAKQVFAVYEAGPWPIRLRSAAPRAVTPSENKPIPRLTHEPS